MALHYAGMTRCMVTRVCFEHSACVRERVDWRATSAFTYAPHQLNGLQLAVVGRSIEQGMVPVRHELLGHHSVDVRVCGEVRLDSSPELLQARPSSASSLNLVAGIARSPFSRDALHSAVTQEVSQLPLLLCCG